MKTKEEKYPEYPTNFLYVNSIAATTIAAATTTNNVFNVK